MKFCEFNYCRPDIKEMEKQFAQLLQAFTEAQSYQEQDQRMKEINGLREEFESMKEIAGIRHTIDTTDEFYTGEQDFLDEVQPIYEGLTAKYYDALCRSEFRGELEQKWGRQLFCLAELTVKTFSPEIIEDLQRENKLTSEYEALLASASIPFEGEERNLSQLLPFQQSTDRQMRKKAYEAKYAFLQAQEERLDGIYDELVKVRTEIARKLGYSSFVELGYARMKRTDYDAGMTAVFRKQIAEYIVPLAEKLRKRQQNRIGLETLYYYDEDFNFSTGNALPKGDAQWILDQAQGMYGELSPETDEFFRFMVESQLMDLISKKGKAGGGYCTYIGKYKAPFIFSNFSGTAYDIDVMTHEAGHAFQAYASRHYEVPEYAFPTYEACEIHSTAMEFFAWPWMELFFGEDGDKYRFSHLTEMLTFMPYAAAVDEFQHVVYESPELTPKERKQAWREIEKKYLPGKNYEQNSYLEEGGFWQQQGHIFEDPFYYIDYALAQICALQFWKKSNSGDEEAWEEYIRLCKEGGSKSFLELVEIAKLVSPFEEGCIQSVLADIEKWLDSVEDSQL